MKQHHARFTLLIGLGLTLAACGQPAAPTETMTAQARGSTLPTLGTLAPGKRQELNQNLRVNVVFVGYEQGSGPQQISTDTFKAQLPQSYRTVRRYPAFYGLPADMGINFTYDYNVVYADQTYEDRFFDFLKTSATPAPLTLFQEAYNKQVYPPEATDPDATNIARTITDTVAIDAPSTEKWLANNAPAGVDTTQYTVYFINWYGRSDYQDHVYTKTGEPDPDTGFDFGLLNSRKLIAWGGTPSDDEETGAGQKANARVWFHDLSAGPESWTSNWDITNTDVDGNDVADYRLPPVWEYGSTKATYRPFTDLSGDLGKVTRYAAINLLFTASPLYSPAISPPALPRHIDLDVTIFQGEAGFDATTLLKPDLFRAELQDLQPNTQFSVDVDSAPFDGRLLEVYKCYLEGSSCYGNAISKAGYGDLFKYHNSRITQYLEGDGDYELPIFAYHAGELDIPFLGIADDNYADGTQSYVWGADNATTRQRYGLTTTLIHEVGHHLGMSHPHDGYDSETGLDYGGYDEFTYANVADESNSMMSYIDLNWDFSQFDRDNMNRYLTSVYLNQANNLLAKLASSSKAGGLTAALTTADTAAASALSAYASMNYAGAVKQAHTAYFTVLDAMTAAGIKVEPQAWPADYKAKSGNPRFVDTVNYLRNLP
ncbi:zinc metalloprotease [Deinococcus ficus]|uniref:hypothetical protein n=1 Tax=Deinococcus ficus TaxID=317577 RepID=UPI0003B69A1B|nr:hypothetical protein [Deinococcus ficus]